MIATFLAIILASLGLALASRRGHDHQGAREFFTAAGQFGPVLFFFLSVGETYSVASMLGFPGAVFAKGGGFVTWFFGYILLAAPVLYFAGPLIWRAGRLYGAATIPDFFGRHFDSRALERVMALAAIALLVPVGTTQFLGLRIVLASLGLPVPPLVLVVLAGLMAFLYVVIAGLRASAFVAILKDGLMLATIVLVGAMAISHWPAASHAPAPLPAETLLGRDKLFSISTMLVQAIGFAMIPQTWAFVFSARSAGAIRRAQVVSPLYLLLFPLLMAVAYYARQQGLHPPQPDFVFITTAQALLPGWMVGVVLAAITLSGLVLVAAVCLAIGPLVTRNVVAGLDEGAQQRWARVITAVYLLASIAGMAVAGKLIVTLNNLFYFGIVQFVPGFAAALWLARAGAGAVLAGMAAGWLVAFGLYFGGVDTGGANVGLLGVLANGAVLLAVARLAPRRGAQAVLARLAA